MEGPTLKRASSKRYLHLARGAEREAKLGSGRIPQRSVRRPCRRARKRSRPSTEQHRKRRVRRGSTPQARSLLIGGARKDFLNQGLLDSTGTLSPTIPGVSTRSLLLCPRKGSDSESGSRLCQPRGRAQDRQVRSGRSPQRLTLQLTRGKNWFSRPTLPTPPLPPTRGVATLHHSGSRVHLGRFTMPSQVSGSRRTFRLEEGIHAEDIRRAPSCPRRRTRLCTPLNQTTQAFHPDRG